MLLLIRQYTSDLFHFYSILITLLLIALLLFLEFSEDTTEMKKGKLLLYPAILILGLLLIKIIITSF